MTNAVTQHAPGGVRCSDADRERTSERLRMATGEGYVTMDELEDRLTGVYSARYRHELDALVADLPQAAEPQSTTGWRAVLAMALRQFGADLALLLGRGGAGWTRRRMVIAILAALVVAGVVISAYHGFGGDGVDHRGVGPEGFAGPRHGF